MCRIEMQTLCFIPSFLCLVIFGICPVPKIDSFGDKRRYSVADGFAAESLFPSGTVRCMLWDRGPGTSTRLIVLD